MKKTVHSNHHLVVHLDNSESFGMFRQHMKPGSPRYNEAMLTRYAAAKNAILRHVDGLELGSDNHVSPSAVEIRYTSTNVCSFCERTWEVLTRTMIGEGTNPDGTCEYFEDPVDGVGLPLCCEKAQQEWRAEQRVVLGGAG